MEHKSFVLKIDPTRVEEYKLRHEQVYPELEKQFGLVGIHRYHIFFHEGTLFAYMEVENYEKAMQQLADHPANKKWQEYMSDMLLNWDDGEKVKDIQEMYKYTK